MKRGHLSSDGTRQPGPPRNTCGCQSCCDRFGAPSWESEQFSVESLPWGFCLDFPGSDHYALIRSREDLKELSDLLRKVLKETAP